MRAMLLLASRSPQRSALLSLAGCPYALVEHVCDESRITAADPFLLAEARAAAKARTALIDDWRERLEADAAAVLAADTVAVAGGEAIGKPRDDADAIRILERLQGSRHEVVTACCCWRPATEGVGERFAAQRSVTGVRMRPMSRAEIETYVASGESAGRAGAYAYQEHGDRFVARLDGAEDTVIGLHVPAVLRCYRAVTGVPLLGE